MEICAAKNLEIMASGAILFTNKFEGIDFLFSKDDYCSYENDGSDVISKGQRILNDPAYVNMVLNNAKICINEKHSHKIRNGQLMEIFKRYA